ncbi:MAG: hypothetical protein AAF573_19540, partial [Bacteroidota bacterium]
MSNSNIFDPFGEINERELKEYTIGYFIIIGLSFIFPLMMATAINEGVAFVKIIWWFQNDILFYEVKQYLILSLIVFFLPIIYLWWLANLTIKKILLRVHKDFFVEWNKELSELIADYCINSSQKLQDGELTDFMDKILFWMNDKLSKFPKWLRWISKKLFEQIPYVNIVNAIIFHDEFTK